MIDTVGRTYGAQSMTAPLREVLVKAPGPAFGAAFDDPAVGFLRPVDLEQARREHAAFVEALDGLGVRVHVLEAETPDPDLVYVFDPLLIADGGAIPLRPGKPNRAGEPTVLEAWTTAHGIPTLGRIEAPGTIEGGDTFWLRPDLLCIGRSLRTNDAGARQLAAIVGGDARVFDVPYWKGDAELVHLLSVVSPVADDVAVVFLPLLPAGLYRACCPTSACAWSRCPRTSTRRSAATCSRSGRASWSWRTGTRSRDAASRRRAARCTSCRWTRSAGTGRAA